MKPSSPSSWRSPPSPRPSPCPRSPPRRPSRSAHRRQFGPKSLTHQDGRHRQVPVGRGKLPHNVAITKGPTKGTISKVRTKGSVSQKFTTTGTYTIVCTIHPGMTLKLKVS